jgi:hypothetical protein
MATQELAGFLAAIILAQRTGLIDKLLDTKNGDGGLIGPPAPPPKDDLPPDDSDQFSNVCLTKEQYDRRYGKASEQEYREYIKLSGCEIIPV